ncbi:MAG: hypothetical protein ALAOOOJD_04037 [bacterium]|nr:hypothetical protein [bacterium]
MDFTKKVLLSALLVFMRMLFGTEASAQKAVESLPGVVLAEFPQGRKFSEVHNLGMFSNLDSVSKQGWLSLGLDAMGNRDFFGLGGFAGFSYLTENRLVSIRLSNNERISMAEPALNGGIPGGQAYRVTSITEVSALYGFAKKYEWLLVSFSTGAGFVTGKESNKKIERSFTTIGLPFDVQILVRPFPVLGVGVIGSVNLNSKTTFTSFMFGLQFGRLK